MQIEKIYAKKLRFILWAELICHFLKYTFFNIYDYGLFIDTPLTILASIFTLSHASVIINPKIKKITIWIIILALISIIMNMYTTGLGGIYTLLRFILYYLLLPGFRITNKEKKLIPLLFITQLLLLSVIDISNYNTNTIGITYFIIGVFVTFPLNFSKKIHLLAFVIISIYIAKQILITDSRTSLIAYGFFIVLCLTPLKLYKIKLLQIFLLSCLTFGSLFYTWFYVYLADNNLVTEEIVEVSRVNTGKTVFSGRQVIWKECFQLIEENPFWGAGSKVNLKSFASVNIHNSYLNLFVIYGIPIGLLCIYFTFIVVFRLRDRLYDEIVRKGIAAFFAFMFAGFSETILIVNPFVTVLGLIYAYSQTKNKLLCQRK